VVENTAAAQGSVYVEEPTLTELNAQVVHGSSTWPRLDKCPVCASTRLAAMGTIRHSAFSRCRACGLTFANPPPPESVLERFYNSAYYANWRTLERDQIARRRYFSVSLYRDIRALADLLVGYLPSRQASVLDVGCGAGAFLALLRDEYQLTQIVGLEINRDSAEIALGVYGVRLASHWDELESSYDAILLLEVLEHVPDSGTFFQASPSACGRAASCS
jgi:SAM-dependent methyltransferase